MLFGCPLPNERGGASIGQLAVAGAFEAILSSAADKHPRSLYKAICDAHKQLGNDIKLVKYLFMCPQAMFAHVTDHSRHSNWNHYGTRLRKKVA